MLNFQQILQVDHCKEELNIWRDEQKFRACGDAKAGIPPEMIVKLFFKVTQTCTANSYKKRGSMDEVLGKLHDVGYLPHENY